MSADTQPPPWADRLSLKQAAFFLDMGLSTLQKLMAAGQGPRGEKFLGRWEFDRSELIRWRQSKYRVS